MKRRKLELAITVIIYVMTAFLASAMAVGILKEFSKLTKEFRHGSMWITAVLPAVLAECVAMVISLYEGRYSFEKKRFFDYFGNVFRSTVYFVGVWAAVLLIQKNSITASRYFFVTTTVFHFIILFFLLYFTQKTIIANFYKTDAATLVAIVSTRADAAEASAVLKSDWSRRIVGIMLIDGEGVSTSEEIDHIPVMAYGDDIIDCIRKSAIDEVFIFDEEDQKAEISKIIEELAEMGVSVHLNLRSIENLEKKLSDDSQKYIPKMNVRLGFIEKYPMAILEPPVMKLRYEYLKRCLDIMGGIVGAIIAIILYFCVGLAIKMDSPGPIIFAQERIGKNGRRFKMFKFRSMYQDAEARKVELMKQNEMNGLMFKMKDDPRITKVGKFIRKTSLDEFPQFFNVLLGDMSLVGTRPPTVNEFREYSNYHKRRLSMKPGITGMWQVSGRSDITDFEEVVKLDCKYIDNWSLGLDFKILVKTVLAVVMRKGSE